MNTQQKANHLNALMQQLEGDFRRENRPHAAIRVAEARIELMASPESAARLYDIIRETEPTRTAPSWMLHAYRKDDGRRIEMNFGIDADQARMIGYLIQKHGVLVDDPAVAISRLELYTPHGAREWKWER